MKSLNIENIKNACKFLNMFKGTVEHLRMSIKFLNRYD